MKNRMLSLCLSVIASLFFAGSVFAFNIPQNYLMWQMPGVNISLPVYVYSDGKQVGYIPSDSLQVFADKYMPGKTDAAYQLYYQGESNWHSCNITLTDGSIDTTKTTCPGAVLNPPVAQNGAQSNVWTLGLGATAWPIASTLPSVMPTKTNFDDRALIFENNTKYKMIQVGESCNTSTRPDCQTNTDIARIARDGKFEIHVGYHGLISGAFYLTGYCTADTKKECEYSKNWVKTGGYYPGETPYAVKIEPTILGVTDIPINGRNVEVPNGASNIDVSSVDGYNFGVQVYPASPEYCTYTVPPENSNVLGAGYYGSKNALAQLIPSSAHALEKLCAQSSQLPADDKMNTQKWNLSQLSSSQVFEGCMSPCDYAKKHFGVDSQQADQFCCAGKYDTPATCDVAPGQVGANTSTYNTNIENSSEFSHVYGFAYGDAGNDYGCPPETNFVVSFVSNAEPLLPLHVYFNGKGRTWHAMLVNWKLAPDEISAANTTAVAYLTEPLINGEASAPSDRINGKVGISDDGTAYAVFNRAKWASYKAYDVIVTVKAGGKKYQGSVIIPAAQ